MIAFKIYHFHLGFQKQLFQLFSQYVSFDLRCQALQIVSIHDAIFFHFFSILTLDFLNSCMYFQL